LIESPNQPGRGDAHPDPAAVTPPPTFSITIDIAGLLQAQARTLEALGLGDFEGSVALRENPRVEPMFGLIARSIQGSVEFLELPHLRILVLLSQENAMTVAELSSLVKVEGRPLAALLDMMEASGWIVGGSPVRALDDTIVISPQGKNVIQSMTERRQRDIDKIMARMSEADRAAVATAFSSFAAAAGEPPVKKPQT
jgi:DNA-binding MarR family transcriptional regulator